MQLDRTLIAVRERNVLDILDLSLHVLRVYARPVFFTFLLGAVPLGVLNYLLIGWIPDYELRGESIPRYCWLMLVLVYLETPLAGAFTTTYLGKAVFMQAPNMREVAADVGRSAAALIWSQLLLRGVLPAWLLLLMLDRYGEFNFGVEIGMLLLLGMFVTAIRGFRPFITEVVLLEKNPLFSNNSGTMTIGRRSSRLHSPNSGEVLGRWIICAVVALLLTLSLSWTMLWFPGVFTNRWLFGPFMAQIGFPAALWLVACYFTVARFLNYLDLRIRQEGWEVELRVRAEAARLTHRLNAAAGPSLAGKTASRASVLLLLALATWLPWTPPAAAQEVDPAESARRALASRRDMPWYDAQSDSLRRVAVEPRNPDPDPARPDWQAQPATPRNWSWLEYFGKALYWLAWAGLVAIILLLIWLLVRAFLLNEEGTAMGHGGAAVDDEPGRSDADRIEQLAFRVNRGSQADLLAEARRLYEAGNFREAIIYLFSFQLLLLDRHHLIRLAKGKTNRQYLREAGSSRRIGDLLAGVMVPFEDVFFGDHDLQRERFEGCWNALSEFQQLVEKESPAS